MRLIFMINSRSLPYVSACVHRHIHNCSEDEKKTVMTIGQKLMARVGDRCPQVSCDVCRAERCLQRLDGLEKNDSYCRYDTVWSFAKCLLET
ncbi:hypothetical protein DPMN_098271 [Dreissena polymorpha]|uniref:Uncharacterized protein n=1 Tax=Dreissena polymorpha TaxID=45954 RepID=A0A9D4LEW0_DREPO|nr:hypothetical protein DPMN_098271 [Dreissena polymorpha]